jgi:hypothetical protein
MIQFDVQRFPKDLREAIWSDRKTLNMTGRTHFQTSRNITNEGGNDAEVSARSSVLRLAPWHFHPEHREFLPDGSWKLVDSSRLSSSNDTDSESNPSLPKKWKGLPLPTYSPNDFLEEAVMVEYEARKSKEASTADMPPSWCREYFKLEEGPSSMAELQRDVLWERTLKLETELESRIVAFRTRERELEAELEKLQGKYDEKKFLKRRDKKRKRNNNRNSSSSNNNNNNAAIVTTANVLPAAIQDKEAIHRKRRSTKERSEPMGLQGTHNPSSYSGVDGQANDTADVTNDGSNRHDASPAMEPTRRRDSHRMGPLHYTNHPQQQQQLQQQQPHHHRHHPYYPQQPQHHSHHRSHPNRVELRHHPPQLYHHHPQQQQPPEGSYPPPPQQQHPHQVYHPRHGDPEDQYREHPPSQEPQHPQEGPQRPQEQQQQQQQRPPPQRHYPEQPDWQRDYYN